MTHAKIKIDVPQPLLDHTQLPDEDGTFVKNFQEHPQSILLTDSIGAILQQRHPDGNYAIGQDSGIYWRQTEPPEKGAVSPDWFYVPNVPPLLDGEFRRSYCLWQEPTAPLIALEFASGDGTEELDKTPLSVSPDDKITKPGKFWVYEQIIQIDYYGIYIIKTGNLQMYHLEDNSYRQMSPNERGHYLIEPLGIELGKWEGSYQNQTQLWLRWWDSEGNLLLTGAEGKEIEKARGDRLANQLEQERQARRSAIPQLLATGMSVEQVAQILSLTIEEVRKISGS